MNIDKLNKIPTPCYVCEEEKLEQNLKLLARVQTEADCKILVALKGFALWKTFPLIKKYLPGCCASGLHEARLAREEFGGEVHTYSPAFKDEEFDAILKISDHIVFNSFSQWEKFKDKVGNKKCGIRVNPECSRAPKEIYDACAPKSRLGIKSVEFKNQSLKGITGLHFHALCEQNSDALVKVLQSFEKKFSRFLPQIQWVNFGGGHHITRADYDVDNLINLIKKFRKKYPNIEEVYLEPGEAVGWKAGFLVTSILDVIFNDMAIAIVDTSASAHMPDTIIMPYRPDIRGGGKLAEKKYNYRIGGNTCLFGDIIGDYSFDQALKVGDKLIIEDQIHYTIVQNNTFNGIKLPSIALLKKNGELKILKKFGYEEYKNRNS